MWLGELQAYLKQPGLFLGINLVKFMLRKNNLLKHCWLDFFFHKLCCCSCRWSGRNDDKYFARIGKNAIYIYETKTFGLIDNEPLKAENVMDFCWSPTDPVIALFVPTDADEMQPARVSMYLSYGYKKPSPNFSRCIQSWRIPITEKIIFLGCLK